MSFFKKPVVKNSDANNCLNLNEQHISLNLGNMKLNFDDGSWNIAENQNKMPIDTQTVLESDLSEQLLKLREESNFVKLKNEILLCMLAERECRMKELQKQFLKLTEENNLLKLRHEVLLNLSIERDCKMKELQEEIHKLTEENKNL